MLSDNIRFFINQKGLKNQAVALKAGYHPKVFSAMLCNRKIIKADDVLKIARALDVTPNQLFGIDDRDQT